MLTVPEDKKKVIKSLAESRVSTRYEGTFDDMIAGKGRGVIILLQYAHPSADYNSTLMSM